MRRPYLPLVVSAAVAVVILEFVFYAPLIPGKYVFPCYSFKTGCPDGEIIASYSVSISYRYFGFGAISGLCAGYQVAHSNLVSVDGTASLNDGYCLMTR